MGRYITMELNGKPETLDFEAFYFLKYYGELSGSDPIVKDSVLSNTNSMFRTTCQLVFAGLRTNYKMNRAPFTTTMDEVEEWVGMKSRVEMVKFINDYGSLEKAIEGEDEPGKNGQLLVGAN